MNKVYGIDQLFSASQYFGTESISDKEVFDMAIQAESTKRKPFFSMILTSSTHMPYNTDIDPTFQLSDKTLPESYRHYLNACHYADAQIA